MATLLVATIILLAVLSIAAMWAIRLVIASAIETVHMFIAPKTTQIIVKIGNTTTIINITR